MKKIFLLAAAVAVVLSLNACNNDATVGVIGGADGPTAVIVGDASYGPVMDGTSVEAYINEAVKHTQNGAKAAADEDLVGIYTSHGEMKEQISSIAQNDYSAPKEVYKLTLDKEGLVKTADEVGYYSEFSKLCEMNKLRLATFATNYNATFGANVLAAISVLGENEGYIMPAEFGEDFALYMVYDGGFSSFVAFEKIGNGVIQATMTFVKNSENGIADFTSKMDDLVGKNYTFEKVK